jgi:peroxiredoxin
LPDIAAAGASLAVISPQVARTPRETEEPTPLSFEMLRDFGNRVAEAYGLVFTLPDDLREIYLKFGIDLARGNGDGTWRLPVPARFVIDRQGIIRAVDADPDYTRRPEPAQTVEILSGGRAAVRPPGATDTCPRAGSQDPDPRDRVRGRRERGHAVPQAGDRQPRWRRTHDLRLR